MTTTPPRVLNYTTKVPATATVAEMQQMLAAHGAETVNVSYTNGKPVAVLFSIKTQHGVRHYTLPGGDTRRIHELLRNDAEAKRRGVANEAQAERTAWRILKDWLEAQLALIRTAMVTLDEVMLPYMVVDELGTTVYQRYEESAVLALEPGHVG